MNIDQDYPLAVGMILGVAGEVMSTTDLVHLVWLNVKLLSLS